MRKKPLIGLLLAAAMAAESSADAAFVIKLRNGNEFVTARYWQDSRQVLFETLDGIFGIEKKFVTKIEKTHKPIRLLPTTREVEQAVAANDPKKEEGEAAKPAATAEEPAKRDENDPILRHFISVRDRAKNVDGLLAGELNQLAKDMMDLKRAMQLGGKTETMLDEFRELTEIADRVEEAMKARR